MSDLKLTFLKTAEKVQKSSNILLITHQRPDGDAVGSILALAWWFKNLPRRYTSFCLDQPNTSFNFLEGLEEINTDQKVFQREIFDLMIVLDSGDLNYAGVDNLIKSLKYPRPSLINIDHHPSNTYYGDLNLIDSKAASTTEIIYRFFDELRISIDKEAATHLLTGILTDTGSFSNSSTSISSLEVASKLLIKGARVKQIIYNTLRNKSIKSLKLWGRALSRLKKDEKTGFVTTVITQEDLKECQADEEASEGVANFLNNLDEAKVVLVLKEQPDGYIKGSFRTNEENLDVSKLAAQLGGGGHKKAAGFTIKGKLQKTPRGWIII